MKLLRGLFAWFDDRLGLSTAIWPIVRHPVPRRVNWWYVFGSATLTAFIVQVITGVALAMTYVPAPNSAYQTLQFISTSATFGSVIRGMHFFGASAMVILILVHMTRVFLMGSFKYPRELNWITGVVLLALTLAMALTGQLLRWDQNAFWSTVIVTEATAKMPLVGPLLARILLAGRTVGGATLTRFFAVHVFLIPALIFGFIGVHLYLVVKEGISEPPEPGRPVEPSTYRRYYHALLERGVPFFPDGVWKDAVFAAGVVGAIIALAVIVGPPALERTADPTIVQAYPRPDWYFIWFFAVLALLPPGIENVVILGFPVVVFETLALITLLANRGERSPRRRPWALCAVSIPLLFVAVLTQEGFAAPWSPKVQAWSSDPVPVGIVGRLDPEALKGAQVFQDRGCRSCHSLGNLGGNRGPNLTAVGDRLTPDQLTIRVVNGGGNMPAYGSTLTQPQVETLVSFLQSLRSPGSEPAHPAPVSSPVAHGAAPPGR